VQLTDLTNETATFRLIGPESDAQNEQLVLVQLLVNHTPLTS